MRHAPAVSEVERARQLRAWVAVGLWIAVIFALSTDAFSARDTGAWLRAFLRFLFPEIPGPTIYLIHRTLRKGAHVAAYGVLALLTLRALRLSLAGGFARAAALALALVGSVAIADEIHQSTTSARTGSRADVALDLAGGSGALAGLALVRAARRPRAET
jgi:VanZ family protein